MNTRVILVCAQLFFALSISSLFGTTMHVLIAGDERGGIKDSVKKDVKKMRDIANIVSSRIDVKCNFRNIDAKQLSSKTVLKWIKKARVGLKDIFIFYFSGHGFRSKTHSKWPLIYFSKRDETLDLDIIIKAIEVKRPQLSLILCDACNNGMKNARFKQLFMREKASIVICAARPNENAWASEKGGLMTLTFISELKKEVKQQSPSWKHLLTRMKRKSKNIQKPLMQWKAGGSACNADGKKVERDL